MAVSESMNQRGVSQVMFLGAVMKMKMGVGVRAMMGIKRF